MCYTSRIVRRVTVLCVLGVALAGCQQFTPPTIPYVEEFEAVVFGAPVSYRVTEPGLLTQLYERPEGLVIGKAFYANGRCYAYIDGSLEPGSLLLTVVTHETAHCFDYLLLNSSHAGLEPTREQPDAFEVYAEAYTDTYLTACGEYFLGVAAMSREALPGGRFTLGRDWLTDCPDMPAPQLSAL